MGKNVFKLSIPAIGQTRSVTLIVEEKEETDYKLDNKGYITRVDDVEGTKYDRLFATDENGEIDKSKFIKIKKNEVIGDTIISNMTVKNIKTRIVPEGEDTTTKLETNITTSSSKENTFNFFKFVADNSNVEWSINKVNVNDISIYQIGTHHGTHPYYSASPGFEFGNIGSWLGMVHSHPGEINYSDRKESISGDRGVSRTYHQNYGRNKPYLVYFPNGKRRIYKLLTFTDAIGQKATRVNFNYKNFRF